MYALTRSSRAYIATHTIKVARDQWTWRSPPRDRTTARTKNRRPSISRTCRGLTARGTIEKFHFRPFRWKSSLRKFWTVVIATDSLRYFSDERILEESRFLAFLRDSLTFILWNWKSLWRSSWNLSWQTVSSSSWHVTTASSIRRLERNSRNLPGDSSSDQSPVPRSQIYRHWLCKTKRKTIISRRLHSLSAVRTLWYIFRLLKSLYEGRGRREGRTAVTCSAICVK